MSSECLVRSQRDSWSSIKPDILSYCQHPIITEPLLFSLLKFRSCLWRKFLIKCQNKLFCRHLNFYNLWFCSWIYDKTELKVSGKCMFKILYWHIFNKIVFFFRWSFSHQLRVWAYYIVIYEKYTRMANLINLQQT